MKAASQSKGQRVLTCLDSHGDDVRHVVPLRGAQRAERVGGWVGGAHLHPGGALRLHTELHQTPLLLHHLA